MNTFTPENPTTVLITGASGLIGGRLIESLLTPRHVCVRAASRIERIWPDGVEGYVVDQERAETLHAACEGVDAVINLAAMSERRCALEPQLALRINAGGTLAWSMAATAMGVRRFVQVSTYKVYGNNPAGVVSEESRTEPRSHYAITHHASEDYARLHASATVLRLANGFGAPVTSGVDCWDIIVNQFCRQALTEGRITIRSSGLALRNFIPMSDVVMALAHAAFQLPAGIYNLGAAQSMSLVDAAERVAAVCFEIFGFAPAIQAGAPAANEVHPKLDFRTDKLARAGFQPNGAMDDELARTLRTALAAFGRMADV